MSPSERHPQADIGTEVRVDGQLREVVNTMNLDWERIKPLTWW